MIEFKIASLIALLGALLFGLHFGTAPAVDK
jgi:hypothetical protein